MLRIRLLSIAFITAGLLTVTMESAFGILVLLPSSRHVPFSQSYPEHARQQVRAALETENSRFLKGRFGGRTTTLEYQGDTVALNEMLAKLADCPNAVVGVTFQEMDSEWDWMITNDVRGMTFQVTINLKSERISLPQLIIPRAMGPTLQRESEGS